MLIFRADILSGREGSSIWVSTNPGAIWVRVVSAELAFRKGMRQISKIKEQIRQWICEVYQKEGKRRSNVFIFIIYFLESDAYGYGACLLLEKPKK